ncbi:ribonuclease P protein component [Alloscardovia venturai]|uniref:Ribonuclease P protein component n=1 Tax=Alloscardovia venturai TaxID=1769421 RepID=A0ABW2Y458_9BIFI
MERLKSHQDFTAVLRKRKKVSSKDIVVHFIVRPSYEENDQRGGLVSSKGSVRLGLAVTKSVGNAVKRNAVKRRFRVLARRYEHLLPDGIFLDLVMRAKPGIYDVPSRELDPQVEKIFTKIAALTTKSSEVTTLISHDDIATGTARL